MVLVHCTRTKCGNTRDTYKHTNGTERPAEGPHIPFSGQFDLCQGRWTLGTGGILGKNTQLKLSDLCSRKGKRSNQPAEEARSRFQKFKNNVPVWSVGVNPYDRGDETHLPDI